MEGGGIDYPCESKGTYKDHDFVKKHIEQMIDYMADKKEFIEKMHKTIVDVISDMLFSDLVIVTLEYVDVGEMFYELRHL